MKRAMTITMSTALAVLFLGVGEVATAADGKAIFDKSCAACHKNMNPKLGNKEQWAPRLKQGTDALVQSVIKGKGTMPPKGGNSSLSEEDIKATVEYIISQAK